MGFIARYYLPTFIASITTVFVDSITTPPIHFQNNSESYKIVVFEALFHSSHLVCGLEIAL